MRFHYCKKKKKNENIFQRWVRKVWDDKNKIFKADPFQVSCYLTVSEENGRRLKCWKNRKLVNSMNWAWALECVHLTWIEIFEKWT